MNWGHKITIFFVAFVIFMIGMVTVSMRADFSLVEENYYEEEIAYQQKIDQLNNGQKWSSVISIIQEAEFLEIHFEDAALIKQGEMTFFRPSNNDLDFKLPIVENFSLQKDKLLAGKWEVKFRWSYEGKSYQRNKIIFISS
jgi:hypothetical protein